MTYQRIIELAHSQALELWNHARDLHQSCPCELTAIKERKAKEELVAITALLRNETGVN